MLRLQFVERTLYPVQKPKGCKRSDRPWNVACEIVCSTCLIPDSGKVSVAGTVICPLCTARLTLFALPCDFYRKCHIQVMDAGLSLLALGKGWNGAVPDSGHAMEEAMPYTDSAEMRQRCVISARRPSALTNKDNLHRQFYLLCLHPGCPQSAWKTSFISSRTIPAPDRETLLLQMVFCGGTRAISVPWPYRS